MSQANQGELFEPMSADLADLLDHPAAGEVLAERDNWPRMLADLVEVTAAALRRRDRTKPAALKDAETVVLALAEYFGGRMTYLPRNDALRRALRDALIWQEFDGRNVPALCDRHRLTPQAVYQILAEQKALHVTKRQGKLFEGA